MIVALILAGIFYLIGAFIAGKILKRKAKTWQAIIGAAILFIGWLWLLHVSYEGNVPSVSSSQSCIFINHAFLGA
jgi:drug/metabolite transporter superfamily protein YnfA